MKLHLFPGTLRAESPVNTLKMARLLARHVGISRVAELTYLDNIGLPVFSCVRPLAKSLTTSLGKGLTMELALCSAYMEAIEHFCAENINPIEIAQSKLIEQAALIVTANRLPQSPIHHQVVNCNFWVIGENQINQKKYYVPYSYVSLDLRNIKTPDNTFAKTSTGLASGNTAEEALIHSLCELIERNAVAEFLASSNVIKRERLLDVNSIYEEIPQKLIRNIIDAENKLYIYDITNAFGVPSYYCVIASNNHFRLLGQYYGSGTHPNKAIAISRALTEAVQSRLGYISGARDDIYPWNYEVVWTEKKIIGAYDFSTTSTISTQDSKIIIDFLLERCVQNNFSEVITITHASIEGIETFSVLHTLIPGLLI